MAGELTIQEFIEAIKNLKVETDYALYFFNHKKERNIETSSLYEITSCSITPIEAGMEKLKRLREKTSVRTQANKSDFSRLMGISRTTVYNWEDRGLLIFTRDSRKIDLIKTLQFWEHLHQSQFTYFR